MTDVSLAHWRANAPPPDASGYSAELHGIVPVQGYGYIEGQPWYFRARSGRWQFAVAADPDGDPLDVLWPQPGKRDRAPGFSITEHGCDEFMDLEEARVIIGRCLAAYLVSRGLDAV